MLRKKGTVLVTALSFVIAAISPLMVAEAAGTSKHVPYQITYTLPVHLSKHLALPVEVVTILNPQPQELLRKHLYTAYEIDSRGGYEGKPGQADTFVMTKEGFLLDLYNWIGIIPPVYPEGYDPADIDYKISQAVPESSEWSALKRKRAQKNLQARLQALIQAGYLQPEEIGEGWATKEFVATILYRMFKQVRPYQGSAAPIDSQSEAVRWAIEAGIPGFEPDQNGKIYPQNRLNQSGGADNLPETLTHKKVFDFLTVAFPGKKTNQGWEYYQLQVKPDAALLACSDCFIQLDGKPLQQAFALHPAVQKDPAFLDQLKQVTQKQNKEAVSQFPKLLQQIREDAGKRRIGDWRRDVLKNSTLQPLIEHYRTTKTSEAAEAVYLAVAKQYNLSVQQDSLTVIKSVLDNVKEQ